MKTTILSWLLHHANRSIGFEQLGRDEFYRIKDHILKRYGSHVHYDVQKIPGKKCFTCGGTGVYTGYYEMSGEQWQDTCNRCFRGWFKLPKWICLSRIKFGRYYFHKPLRREECVKNPWTEENMGWKVSDRPIITGYIEHNRSRYGQLALLMLYWYYDRLTYHRWKDTLIRSVRWDMIWKWRRVKKKFHPSRLLISTPHINTHTLDSDGNIVEDLPF